MMITEYFELKDTHKDHKSSTPVAQESHHVPDIIV